MAQDLPAQPKTFRQRTAEAVGVVQEKLSRALRIDGWVNVLTQLGVWGQDKRLSGKVCWYRMSREEQENIYAVDPIMRKLIDMVPDEAMEKGYRITNLGDLEGAMIARLRQLKFDERMKEAWVNDRIHGGAALFKVCADGGIDTPLPKGRPILALTVMTRWELFAWSTYIESDVTSPRFGEPFLYQLQITEGQKTYSQPIHASRLVIFPGTYLPRMLRKQNNYWGDSEINRLLNPVRNYSQSQDAIANAILDFSIPVLKMKDLAQLVGAQGDGQQSGDNQIVNRLNLINISKSIARMVVLDADKEEFQYVARQVTGLPELMDKVEGHLVAVTMAPKTKISGVSPKGLGGEGSHEEVNWYDHLKGRQENYLKPRMLDVIRHIIDTEPPFRGAIDSSTVDIEFNPLWQQDEEEQADTRLKIAQADQIYMQAGAVDPTEVAKSRFGGPDGFSSETNIDMNLRVETHGTGETAPSNPASTVPWDSLNPTRVPTPGGPADPNNGPDAVTGGVGGVDISPQMTNVPAALETNNPIQPSSTKENP